MSASAKQQSEIELFFFWLSICTSSTGRASLSYSLARKEKQYCCGPKARSPLQQVYHLASVRLRDLCVKLDISDELRKKIWTCFEYSLVHCPEIMMDRHLEQLLMCAIYVMAKVRYE